MSQNDDNAITDAASPDKKVAPRLYDARTPMTLTTTIPLPQPRIEPTRNSNNESSSRVSFRQDSSSASARSKLLFGDASGSILAPATRFPTETDNTNSHQSTPEGVAKKGAASSKSVSLFSSVMKNVQQSTPAKPARSLTDFLDGLDSPFSPTPQTPKSATSASAATPATLGTPLNDWIEYDVGDTIDWSVYDRVELQAQPSIPMMDTTEDDTAALAAFASSSTPPTWGTTRYYWEHPAVPLPAEFRKDKASQRKRSFREMVRQQDTAGFTLHRPSSAHENDNESPWMLRKRQWQEAFRSLYCKFKSFSAADNDEDNLYFVSTLPDDHTLLFRWKDHEPQVTINKCGVQFREQLRARGATLWFRKDKPFAEAMLVDSNSAWHAASPSTKAELIELRRAQARGETLGADIAVQSSMGKRRVPVLTVRGVDDCDALLEVYMNRYGQTMGTTLLGDTATTTASSNATTTSTPMNDADVPKLLCRHLGPFLHASLHKLRPSGNGWMGSVLPCAVRELQGLACDALVAAAGEENRTKEGAGAPHHWLVRAESDTRNLMVAWDIQRPESLACKVSNF